MTEFNEEELYCRGEKTLLAAWEEVSLGAPGSRVWRESGFAIAIFPNGPERSIYNNAILERNQGASERSASVDAMEHAYADAGVTHFAAWIHEGDGAMREDLEKRGYTFDSSTRAMGMTVDDLRMPRPTIEFGALDWAAYSQLFGFPPGLFSATEQNTLHLVLARDGGENVASAMAFDHEGDCGVFNVVTLEHARRRGLGSALVALQLHDAFDRGCQTASLQSTPMAEGVYAAAGFRDLGRYLEFVPPQTEGTTI